jgi:hypothetical protein
MRSRDESRDSQHPEALDQDRHAGRPAPVAGAGRVLALQRSAGNRSVSALLARDPDAPAPEEEATPMSAGGAGVVTLGDVGAIPVSSATLGSPQEPSGHMGGGSTGRSSTREMSFTSSVGEHSPKLLKAVNDGTAMPVDVAVAAFHVTLTGAIVSRYSTSSGGDTPVESWSLGFTSSDFVKP